MNENYTSHNEDFDNEDDKFENPFEQYTNDDGEIDSRIEFEDSDALLKNLLISDSNMQKKIADIISDRMFGYNPLKGEE